MLDRTSGSVEPILKVNNIESYYGPIKAIGGVSLNVDGGNIVTVLGANGAGKTTVLRSISGVVEVQKGSISYHGREIRKLEPNKIVALGIAHVPEGREVFPQLTVRENLKMGAYLRRDKGAVAADFDLVFEYFPALRARSEQRAGKLSGGEQQMLAISRALLQRPRLLLLDEPSLGLSPRLVDEIFAIIARLRDEQGMTILLVEQNASMALSVADFGYVLEVGRVVLAGPAAQLRENEDIREFYLSVSGFGERGERGERRWKRKKLWR